MNQRDPEETPWVREALRALEVDRLAFLAFDAALPRRAALDPGVGTPLSAEGRSVLDFARRLGFDAIQFGPQGAPSDVNASPYDATAFSRNPLSLDLSELSLSRSEGGLGLFSDDELAKGLEDRPEGLEHRASHRFAFATQTRLLAVAASRFRAARRSAGPELLIALGGEVDAFRRRHVDWLVPDALYDPLCREHAAPDFSLWRHRSRQTVQAAEDATAFCLQKPLRFLPPERSGPASGSGSPGTLFGFELEARCRHRVRALAERFETEIADYAFVQFLVHRQHERLQGWARKCGLELYGDLAVGQSRRDEWHFGALFLPGYRLGAPPSRTNPGGQPWGYPVLDPGLYDAPGAPLGPALSLLAARADKTFAEYDRVRIDHPHGLVCPWVYASDTGDDARAVRNGARLFSSPDTPGHPSLARHSLVEASQLDPGVVPHHDARVRWLSAPQVEAYSRAFDVIAARAHGDPRRLICEVLSTQPRELECALRRHGLGRFRVTQKADAKNPEDVYRTENARPEDWVLLGNHDTPTIWSKVAEWRRTGDVRAQADYLAERLSTGESERVELARRFRESEFELAHGKLAELFACNARSVLIAFADLFGFVEPYNRPGTVSDDNWSLRLPRDFESNYRAAVQARRALWLPKALGLALQRARPGHELHASTPRL